MKKVLIIILLIFSLIIIDEKVYQCESNENINFEQLEKNLIEKTEFVNNALKLEYTIKGTCSDETERIYNLLLAKYGDDVQKNHNQIKVNSSMLQYEIKSYIEADLVKVEIVIINNNSNIEINELKKMAEEIENNNCVDERYFLLVKGKIKKENIDVSMLINSPNIKSHEKLSISNGVTYRIKYSNKESINASLVTYDTGEYIIIGTPIIFLTY